MARNLYEMLKDIVFSFYPMEGYETDMKLRIIEKRTIIGILFMMRTEPFFNETHEVINS